MLLESFQESKIEKGLVISTFYKKVKVEEIYINKKLINHFVLCNQKLFLV